MTAKIVIPSAMVIVFSSLLSCTAGTQTEPNVGGVERAEEKSIGLDPMSAKQQKSSDSASAATDVCEDRPCSSDSDCCKGDSCGFDPERSHVQRYCMGG
jgi:hypothetical protein